MTASKTGEPAGPPTIDLARLDNTQLKRRIELNRDARFGLETATPAQLNIVFILCRRWQLDPVTDITLYQGHPWVTLDGWCRVIRRHPEWTTLRQYPLKKDEKIDWGYAEDDIVVATVLGTKSHGEITGYGKVTRSEVLDAQAQAKASGKRAAPVGVHPVEMASKRSLARAAKVALGLDIPDDVVVEQEVEAELAARNDPGVVKANAQRYDEIFRDDDVEPAPAPRQLPAKIRVQERQEERRSLAWEHNRNLYDQAVGRGQDPRTLRVDASVEEIELANRELEDQLSDDGEEGA